MRVAAFGRVMLVLLAVALGCSGESPRTAVTVTDSAGIEIVTNEADRAGLVRFTLDAEPVLQITSVDGTGAALYQVTDLLPLPDGRLAVASSGTHSVVVFGPDGQPINWFGGQGRGPGEFETIGGLVALGPDSLVAYDYRLGRLTVFGLDGAVGRTVDVSHLTPPSGFSQLHGVPGGFILVGEAGFDALGAAAMARGHAHSFRLDLSGDSTTAYGPFPGTEVFRNDLLMGALAFGSRLFSGTRGDRLIVGSAEAPEIREITPSGATARIIRWADHERRVTDQRMSEYVEFMTRLVPENERSQARDVLLTAPHSPMEPAYNDLIVAASGKIWIGDYPGPESGVPESPGPPRSWLLFDPDGTLTGVVDTPAGLSVMAVEEDRVLGVQRDALGVESVAVYAF